MRIKSLVLSIQAHYRVSRDRPVISRSDCIHDAFVQSGWPVAFRSLWYDVTLSDAISLAFS